MRLIVKVVAFLALMLGCTILCAVIWQRFVTDTLYDCTDSLGGPDYLLSSRHWVHDPVAVQHVVGNRSMSEPDTIKVGWSIAGLICLRWALVGASIVVSFLLTRLLWRPRRVYDSSHEHAA
jgi:hypothetical protein